MKKNIVFYLVIIVWGMSSCSDWLNVKPETSIQEEDLFRSEAGFKDVLTGFYIKMGNEELYGKDLSYGYMEMLAQRYDQMPQVTRPEDLYNYDGTYKEKKNIVFSEVYNIIANINNFLYYLDKNRNVITTNGYYGLMKGEALGLRAFLHFDMLRMFGTAYSVNSNEKSIPYRTAYRKDATPLLPVKEVVELVLNDLHQADSLLEKSDPKIFNAKENSSDRNAFLVLRQLRMNTYAVKAMLARVYCFKGDKESKQLAFKYAQDVVEAGHFMMYETNKENRILFNEHIFGLHVYDLSKIVEGDFMNSSVSQMLGNTVLTITELYETNKGGTTDFRSNETAFAEIKLDGSHNIRILKKFDQNGYRGKYDGAEIIPLIRLPEMYYIMAECIDNPSESADYLNMVRAKRGIPSSDAIIGNVEFDKKDSRPGEEASQTMRTNELMKEYRKEFFGEGQLFYFYKRYNYKTFYHCPLENIRDKYKIPLPENEIIFGNNN